MGPRENDEDWRRAIEGFRNAIDQIDDQLINLIIQRQRLAVEIGRLKRSHGLEISDKGREEEILKRLSLQSRNELPSRAIRAIFLRIITAARLVQRTLIS
jgi:chorismate mutase